MTTRTGSSCAASAQPPDLAAVQPFRRCARHNGPVAAADDTLHDPLRFLDAMKEQERVNAHAATRDALRRYAGSRSGTDPLRFWYGFNPVHNRDLPMFAIQTATANCWTEEATRSLAVSAWVRPEWPNLVGTDLWLELWTKVGFVCDADDPPAACAHQSSEPFTLWRGAPTKYKRHLAWTGDRDRAEWFATRFGDRHQSRVWQVTVTADHVLAHLTRRSEDEYLVNLAGLRVHAATHAH